MLPTLHVAGFTVATPWLALSALLLLACIEGIVLRVGGRAWDARDAAANVAVYAVYLAILFVWTPWLFLLYDAVHAHALFDLGPGSPAARAAPLVVWLALIVAEDLCFYAFHRASHRCRLLWAAHEPHHSSTQLNWTVALRQTWLPFVAAPFWLPLVLFGFDPLMVLTVQTASLLFQALLHTELVGGLGPLEWILNTPSHHRAHHGADAAFVDCNFGGVLIVWDRLLGSFVAAAPRRYGVGESVAPNPLVISGRAPLRLVADVARSRSLGDALGFLVRPPGWQPASAHPKRRT